MSPCLPPLIIKPESERPLILSQLYLALILVDLCFTAEDKEMNPSDNGIFYNKYSSRVLIPEDSNLEAENARNFSHHQEMSRPPESLRGI